MAISIDTGSQLRKPSDLRALVDAIVAAGEADEADWVEWKSTADLSAAAGAFMVSRCILGFANREPTAAQRFTGGLAYVVVGAQPGSVDGVEELDGAVIENALRTYLGDDGPVWNPTYVHVGTKAVLVITVEAPAFGDPLYTLRKTRRPDKGPSGDEGTIFVRHGALVQPANAADIAMLQTRLLKGSAPDQTLDLVVDWPLDNFEVHPLDLSARALDQWVNARRELLLLRTLPPPPAAPAMGALMASVTGAITYDKRTAAEFDDELARHLAECREKLPRWAIADAMSVRLNPTSLRVANPATRNLSDVQLTVTIDRAFASHQQARNWQMPSPPRPQGWADLNMSSPFGLSNPVNRGLLPRIGEIPAAQLLRSRSSVRIKNGKDMSGAHITIDVGDLRPDESMVTEAFMLVVAAEPGTVLHVNWRATSTRVDAIQNGVLSLLVGSPATPLDLVPARFDSDQNG